MEFLEELRASSVEVFEIQAPGFGVFRLQLQVECSFFKSHVGFETGIQGVSGPTVLSFVKELFT